jgi:hypothetical protein
MNSKAGGDKISCMACPHPSIQVAGLHGEDIGALMRSSFFLVHHHLHHDIITTAPSPLPHIVIHMGILIYHPL